MNHAIDKVHCFFEQSGTFKNQFKALGYEAYDYDIQNNFGETDYQIDLFAEIEKGYAGKPSVFDRIGGADLIMAFFPCIYFEAMQMMYYDGSSLNLRNLSYKDKYDIIISHVEERERFLIILYKLYAIVDIRGLQMIIENPATQPHYLMLTQTFIAKPTIIDKNRALRGDYFKKPTAYWFVNRLPTYGQSFNINPAPKRINDMKGGHQGLCSEERSMISPEYAKNFIADFILGQPNENTEPTLF